MDLATVDEIDAVLALFVELGDELAHRNAGGPQRRSGTRRRDEREAELMEQLARFAAEHLVPIGQRQEDRALLGQRTTGGDLTLHERKAGREIDAHDFAGRTHLGSQHRIGLGEAIERQHRFFDRDVVAGNGQARAGPTRNSSSVAPSITRAAILTNGTPVALATNGTVRDARGFASMTKT